MPLLDSQKGPEAVSWRIELTKTHPPQVFLKALMRSPSDALVPISTALAQTVEIKMVPELAQALYDSLGRFLNQD
jgi:hypothetical protein